MNNVWGKLFAKASYNQNCFYDIQEMSIYQIKILICKC